MVFVVKIFLVVQKYKKNIYLQNFKGKKITKKHYKVSVRIV